MADSTRRPAATDGGSFHSVYDSLSPEVKARLAERKQRATRKKYDKLTYFKAQFAMLYGWDALEAFEHNRMTKAYFMAMLRAGLDIREQWEVQRMSDTANAATISDEKTSDRFNNMVQARLKACTPDFEKGE